jgi:hypothetical protein
LAAALAFELVCLIQVNRLFDQVMGGTDRLARDAAANANAANVTAAQAVTGATSALHTAESAGARSRDSMTFSENAQSRSRTALQEIETAEQRSHIATLIAEMNADDALALDTLRSMRSFVDDSQAKAVKDAILEVIRIHRAPMYQGNAPPPWRHVLEESEAEASLNSADPDARQQGLRVLAPRDRQLVPKLFRMAVTDPSIDVRGLAIDRFNDFTSQRFLRLDETQLRQWWDTEGKKEFPEETHLN